MSNLSAPRQVEPNEPVSAEPSERLPDHAPAKKKGLPWWVVVLVLLVVVGIIYYIYSQLLKEKPPIYIKKD